MPHRANHPTAPTADTTAPRAWTHSPIRFAWKWTAPKGRNSAPKPKKLFAEDLPYIPLWFTDVLSVHSRSLGDPTLSRTGGFDFLVSLYRAK